MIPGIHLHRNEPEVCFRKLTDSPRFSIDHGQIMVIHGLDQDGGRFSCTKL